MSKEPLPEPVLDPEKRSKVEANPNHGLWGFFNKDRTSLTKPEDEAKHGMNALILFWEDGYYWVV